MSDKELLTHYNCGECNYWFTLGDMQTEPASCPFYLQKVMAKLC